MNLRTDLTQTNEVEESDVRWPEEVQNRLMDSVLAYLAVLGVPALSISLLRIREYGWQGIFYLHMTALIALWIMVVLRRRLTLRIKVLSSVTIMYGLSIGSFIQFGLVGNGSLYLSLICVIITIFFGRRAGLISVVISAMTILVFLFIMRAGLLFDHLDFSLFAIAPLQWIAAAVSIIVFVGATVVVVGTIQEALYRSRNVLAERKAELERTASALRQREEHLKAVVENTPNVAVEGYDPDGRIVSWNKAAQRIFGYSEEEAIGKNIRELILPGKEGDEFIEKLREVVETGEPWGPADCPAVRSDGQTIWCLSTIFEIPSEDGKRRLICMDVDVTDRRQAEEALKKSEEEKEHFYRDAISSVTNGKLLMVALEEVQRCLETAELTGVIRAAHDISDIRNNLANYFHGKGLSGDELALFLTGVSEAMNNALKHAGGGVVYASASEQDVWAAVVDTGPGITTLTLPSATLRLGYSTKTSMGMGYSIMLDVTDCMFLSTGSQGTAVVLFKNLAEETPALILDDFPDTWISI